MQKTAGKRRLSEKSQKVIFLVVVIAVITAIISTTFAWYIDRKTDVGTIQFGAIEIDRTGSFFQTATVTNLIPGESFVSKISFKRTDRSSAFYSRLKITFSVPEENEVPGMDDLVEDLNNEGPPILYSSSEYTWKRVGDYYYLVEKTKNYVYPVENTDPIVFIEGWIYDTSYEQFFDENGVILQYQQQLIITVTVQAVQKAYLADNINEGTPQEGTQNITPATISPYFTQLS